MASKLNTELTASPDTSGNVSDFNKNIFGLVYNRRVASDGAKQKEKSKVEPVLIKIIAA